jgi:hypothetical protein
MGNSLALMVLGKREVSHSSLRAGMGVAISAAGSVSSLLSRPSTFGNVFVFHL